MSPDTINLWPDDLVAGGAPSADEPSLFKILESQGRLLGQETGELVTAEVTKFARGDKWVYAFDLVAPRLPDYRYRLFSIQFSLKHGLPDYPVRLSVDVPGGVESKRLSSEESVTKELRSAFAAPHTRHVIKWLLDESNK